MDGTNHNPAAIPSEACDVVMKGGVTSGVVYPSAVLRLAERYRFRNVGGASVGAIAAALTAAAEFGRLTGRGTGFAELEKINEEMSREGFLLSLFQPRPAARGLYSVYLAVTRNGLMRTAVAVVRQAPWALLLVFAWWASLAATAVLLDEQWWLVPALLGAWALVFCVVIWAIARRLGWFGPLGGALFALGWPLVVAPAAVGVAAWRDLSANGFGLVGGSTRRGDALCDWLHHHIQTAAGLADDHPLTFGMLRNERAVDGKPAGIELRMVTTNLSIARPLRLPTDLREYLFAAADLDGVLPARVIECLKERGTAEGELFRLPPENDVPVLLAFRLSLSFPLLFTAVRLHAAAVETLRPAPVPHWFSDGGISSNFPIQFFDAWIPRRPTFALSFNPFPLGPDGRLLPDETDIGLPPEANGWKSPRWVDVKNLGSFGAQIIDTMQNWRDTLQSEVPGFRDRVYEARLDRDAGEGGLNLGMDVPTIERLQDRGQRVGGAILETFDWDQHFFTRYLVAMQQLELGLLGDYPPGVERRGSVRDAFSDQRPRFAAGDVGAAELFGHDSAWLPPAGDATWALVTAAEKWADFGQYVSPEPMPQPGMRITPNV